MCSVVARPSRPRALLPASASVNGRRWCCRARCDLLHPGWRRRHSPAAERLRCLLAGLGTGPDDPFMLLEPRSRYSLPKSRRYRKISCEPQSIQCDLVVFSETPRKMVVFTVIESGISVMLPSMTRMMHRRGQGFGTCMATVGILAH